MSRKIKISLLFLAGAIFLLALSGCGDSGSDATGSDSPPLTKAVFVKRASAICEKTRAQYLEDGQKMILEEEPKTSEEQKALELKIIGAVLVPRLEEELAQVRALQPPEADQAQVDEILKAVEEVVEEIKASPKKFSEDQGFFKHPYKHALALAEKYDLEACAQA